MLVKLLCLALFCGTDEIQSSDPVLTQNVLIEEKIGNYFVTADLGVLESGKKYNVALEIQNPTTTNLKVTEVQPACSCTTPSMNDGTISSGGTITFKFNGTVPEKLKVPSSKWKFFLKTDVVGKEIYIVCSYAISGALSFADPSIVLIARDDIPVSNFQIPLILTSPFDRESIAIRASATLSDARHRIILKGEEYYLELAIPYVKVPAIGLSGEIRCRHEVTGRETIILCVIQKQEAVKVFPMFLRFSESPQKSGYVANAMIRIARPKSDDKSPIRVEALFGEQHLAVDLIPVSTEVYRANIFLSLDLADAVMSAAEKRISWVVHVGSKAQKIDSLIRLPSAKESN